MFPGIQQLIVEPAALLRLVRTSSELRVAAGGCFARRPTTNCACTSPGIEPAASTSATPAAAGKQDREPVTHDAARDHDTVGCATGEYEVCWVERHGACFGVRACIRGDPSGVALVSAGSSA
jgi:hypothetical protein